MRKVWKTYQSKPCIVQEMFLWPVELWRKLVQPCGTNLTSKNEDVVGNFVGSFLGLVSHLERNRIFGEREILDSSKEMKE